MQSTPIQSTEITTPLLCEEKSTFAVKQPVLNLKKTTSTKKDECLKMVVLGVI